MAGELASGTKLSTTQDFMGRYHVTNPTVQKFLQVLKEKTFRDHLRLRVADIDPQTVAIGPWWHGGGQDEIDAVALAGRSRKPVLVGEAKWARHIDGNKIRARLARKALALTEDIEHLRYAVCAREEITATDPNLWRITAEDIFGEPGSG